MSESTRNLEANSMSPDAAIVAFVGVTGSGKTSFIQSITGRSDVVPSEGLEADTQTITSYPVRIDRLDLILVDTPGFNDTYRSDYEILNELAQWLEGTYKGGRKLSGIVYMHRISSSRMMGSTQINLAVFKKLCGSNSFQNVTLCTTFWDLVDPETGARREKQLMERYNYWGEMVNKGAKVERIHDYAQSMHILRRFTTINRTVLSVQQEMVDRSQPFHKSSAAKTLEEEIEESIKDLETIKINPGHEQCIASETNFGTIESPSNKTIGVKDALAAQEELRKLKEENRRIKEEIEAARRKIEANAAAQMEKLQAERDEELRKLKEENRRMKEEKEAADRKRAEYEASRLERMRGQREVELRNQTRERFRGFFKEQNKQLYQAQVSRRINIRTYTSSGQDRRYLAWCDHCFGMMGALPHFYCQRCEFDVCNFCWSENRNCKSRDHRMQPVVLPGTTANNTCRRLMQNEVGVNCDVCFRPVIGMCFHCCSCCNDDFDICLTCVMNGRTCRNWQHILHPTFCFPSMKSVLANAGLSS